jgi:hypothetical protein
MLLFATATLLAVAAFFGEMAEATSRAQGAFKAPKARTYAHLWNAVSRADGDAAHPVTFFVKPVDGFDVSCPTLLSDISTPGSAKFGQHYSFESLKQFTDMDAFNAVVAFARQHFGAARVDVGPNFDVVSVPDATVAEVEAAFRTHLWEFAHVDDASRTLRRPRSALRLPAKLAGAVTAISGLTELPYHKPAQKPLVTGLTSKRQSNLSTPQVLWAYYNVANQTTPPTSSSRSLPRSASRSTRPTWSRGSRTTTCRRRSSPRSLAPTTRRRARRTRTTASRRRSTCSRSRRRRSSTRRRSAPSTRRCRTSSSTGSTRLRA